MRAGSRVRSRGQNDPEAKVVRRPLADYTRHLLTWGIPENVKAGEDHRIVEAGDGDTGLPDQDFWMFDERVLVHLDYEPDGTRSGRELRQGVPFDEWHAGS
jgi:hypothetical protein